MPEMESGFAIVRNQGFHIKFQNGVTVSVQFGPYSYCGKNIQHEQLDATAIYHANEWYNSRDAEIALWARKGDWLTKKAAMEIEGLELHDDVIGYVTPERVAKYIEWASKQKEEEED